MSRIAELIDCVKIYNLCNHCDHFKCGECSVDDVNCKEEIEKQIVSEIKADVIDECIKLVGGNTKSIVGIVFDNSIPIHDRALGRMAKNKLIEDLVEQLEKMKEQE